MTVVQCSLNQLLVVTFSVKRRRGKLQPPNEMHKQCIKCGLTDHKLYVQTNTVTYRTRIK